MVMRIIRIGVDGPMECRGCCRMHQAPEKESHPRGESPEWAAAGTKHFPAPAHCYPLSVNSPKMSTAHILLARKGPLFSSKLVASGEKTPEAHS